MEALLHNGLSRWEDKVALITGASSGIGAATARALGGMGMRLALTARRAERLDALRQELEGKGVPVLVVTADLTRADAVREVFEAVRREWGGVDVLINNAGLGWRQPVFEAPWERLQTMLDVNVRAATQAIREAVADMEGMRDGAIISISSLGGHRVLAGRGSTFYAATKHALRAVNDGLRMELVAKQSPIKVALLSPGVVETDFHDTATPGGDAGGYAFTPLKAEDISNAIVYILAQPRHVQINDILMRSVEQPH